MKEVGASFDFVDRKVAAALYDETLSKLTTFLGQKSSEGAAIKRAIKSGVAAVYDDPTAPNDLATNEAAKLIWKADLDQTRKRREFYRQGMEQAYDVIYDICSVSLQSTLRNTETFETISENSNALELLSLIHKVMLTQKERKNPTLARTEAREQVVSLRQNDMTVQKYHDVFVQSMEVLRLCGGDIGITRDAVMERLTTDGNANPNGNEILAMTTQMEQEDMAVMFILGADNRRYAILKQELLNDYSKGHDNYPTTLAKARMMLATRQDKTTVLGVRRTDPNNNNNNNNNS
jgi:hypothetical protein